MQKNATQEEIKSAFLERSKEVHPDQNPNPTSHENFVEINQAYMVLSKLDSRRDYDVKMKFGSHPYYDNKYDASANPDHYTSPFGPDRPFDTPYWKKDPFSDYGYEYEQRRREQEWAEKWLRRRDRPGGHHFYPIVQLGQFSMVVLMITFVYLMGRAYKEHPERFKHKVTKDIELEEIIEKRSRDRLEKGEVTIDDSEIEAALGSMRRRDISKRSQEVANRVFYR